MIGWDRRARAVVVGILVVLASGCWTQAGKGPGRQGFNALESTVTAKTVADLDVAWDAPLGSAAGESLVARGRVYARAAGHVAAFDLGTGAPAFDAAGLPGTAVPAVVDTRLLVPTSAGACSLAARDADTGAPLGSVQLGFQDVNGLPSGSSACSTRDALDAGGWLIVPWFYLGQVLVPHCSGGPTTEPSYNITAGITAVNPATLAVAWEHRDTLSGCGAAPPPATWPTPFGSVAEGAGGLIVGGQGTRLVAFDPATCSSSACAPAWSSDLGAAPVGPPIAVGDQLAVVTVIGTISVLDGATGAIAWTGGVSDAATVPLASDGATIFAAGGDGTLAAFAAAGCGAMICDPTWTANTDAAASARPSIGGDVVYVGTGDGTVLAFPAKGCAGTVCADLWSVQPGGGSVTGAPAIVGGRVLFGTADGTTWAYAFPGST